MQEFIRLTSVLENDTQVEGVLLEKCSDVNPELSGLCIYLEDVNLEEVKTYIENSNLNEKEYCLNIFKQNQVAAMKMLLSDLGYKNFTDLYLNQYLSVEKMREVFLNEKVESQESVAFDKANDVSVMDVFPDDMLDTLDFSELNDTVEENEYEAKEVKDIEIEKQVDSSQRNDISSENQYDAIEIEKINRMYELVSDIANTLGIRFVNDDELLNESEVNKLCYILEEQPAKYVKKFLVNALKDSKTSEDLRCATNILSRIFIELKEHGILEE